KVRVYRRWGIQNGKMIETSEVFKAKKGRTAEQRMMEAVERHIQSKIDEGFVLKLKEVRVGVRIRKNEIDLKKLPIEFAPQKPVTEFNEEAKRLAEADRLIYQRKRDGQRHYVLITDKGVARIYSRKMVDKTEHMPRLVRALSNLNLPPCTVIDGEVIVDRNGDDD